MIRNFSFSFGPKHYARDSPFQRLYSLGVSAVNTLASRSPILLHSRCRRSSSAIVTDAPASGYPILLHSRRRCSSYASARKTRITIYQERPTSMEGRWWQVASKAVKYKLRAGLVIACAILLAFEIAGPNALFPDN